MAARKNKYRNVVLIALAYFRREADGIANNLVPGCFGQGFQLTMAHVFVDEAKQDAGIEVVARTDGAHRLKRFHRIILLHRLGAETQAIASIGADEAWTIETHLMLIDLVRIGHAEHIAEVFRRTTDDVGILEVFQDGRHQLDGFVGMGATEIDIIVNDGSGLTCLVGPFGSRCF